MTFFGRNLSMQALGRPLFAPGVEVQLVEEIPIEGKCENIVAAMEKRVYGDDMELGPKWVRLEHAM